ncbi:P-loop containing nucleoside triphosphate hydrolase protein [Cladochytrium replicatum]|nr:P-loop containing nucleoside triphosphate hydrolase protein [Cladochytrium replicatum]
MYMNIGLSAIPGALAPVLLIPLQSAYARQFGKLRKLTEAFIDTILGKREEELKSLGRTNLLKAINEATFFASSGGEFTPARIFTTITLISALQFTLESYVSLQRIQEFLSFPKFSQQIDESAETAIMNATADPEAMIVMHDATFGWLKQASAIAATEKRKAEEAEEVAAGEKLLNEECPAQPGHDSSSLKVKTILENITFVARRGEILGVCGPVGSGKTCDPGDFRRNAAWKRPDWSPKDNEWFWEVVRACTLDRDFERFPEQENAMIGERGITLSGGQSARLALARATYCRPDIVLLDDLLSSTTRLEGTLSNVALSISSPKSVDQQFFSLYTSSSSSRRNEAITHSPVYAAIASALEGLSLIRAFGPEQRFTNRFVGTQDKNTPSGPSTSPLDIAQWCVRQSEEVENLMTSVERILEYTRLPPEEPKTKPVVAPPEDWPSKGQIKFSDMSLTYPSKPADAADPRALNWWIKRSGPKGTELVDQVPKKKLDEVLTDDDVENLPPKPALRNIRIEPRVGSRSFLWVALAQGKVRSCKRSSAWLSRRIHRDRRYPDLSHQRTQLRRRIAIIPQESFLFFQTLRFNLDQLSDHDDSELWQALEVVELKRKVEAFPEKLDTMVAENGGNFNIRIITTTHLKNTLSVTHYRNNVNDLLTDTLVQTAVQRRTSGLFADATVICISHRLFTIIDFDLIVFLDDGAVVEVGAPWELLRKHTKDGWFRRIGRSGSLGVVEEDCIRCRKEKLRPSDLLRGLIQNELSKRK